ncbi:MaoC family dehydratase N-terminal domain-containing protein [Sphingomonas sp.]|uniref:MaoC family dehydratase N-terminal domain-containing protein n=1 Tax=Sphingomonas sp. TaxID=28214 RepID=UPI003D6CE8AC
MIDKKWIGHETAASVLPIDRSRLQFFARAIGETDPLHLDPEAARAAGYADVLAPPTFIFAAELDSGVSDQLLADLEIPLGKLLHGEQSFTFHRSVCAGDTITVRSRIDDIYDKKQGALEFVVKTARAVNQAGELVAEMRSILVCRH